MCSLQVILMCLRTAYRKVPLKNNTERYLQVAKIQPQRSNMSPFEQPAICPEKTHVSQVDASLDSDMCVIKKKLRRLYHIETEIFGLLISHSDKYYCDPKMDESILGGNIRHFAGSAGHQG